MQRVMGTMRLAGVLLVGVSVLAGAPATAVDYSAYHDFGEVESRIAAWAERPEVSVETFGESAGGRPLYAVRLAAAGEVVPDERPAVFVGANIAGYHHAGTEAALHLIETLLAGGEEVAGLLAERTIYVAPVLNPDAHGALFAPVRHRRAANDQRLDGDRDGLVGEDGPDDLDGDGAITWLRIPDPAGEWLPHPDEPRLMVRRDPERGRRGAYLLVPEGRDDDGDGEYGEDPPTGIDVDRNFAHAFPYPDPEAGPWPSYAPEAKAVMDFLLDRRNVAAAVVYGPANNLLAAPESLGGGGDLGSQKFKLPTFAAEMLGFDPEGEYTLDEVWEVAKDLPFVIQNNVTKEQLGQFLGAGPATRVADEDQAVLDRLADDYEERLEAAGLSTDRPAEQYGKGGFTPWLYYQYGVLAFELDVWGVPKPAAAEEEGDGAGSAPPALTVEALADMSAEEVVALGEEAIGRFLEENEVPAQFDAERVIRALESGQVTPAQMARMIGGGGGSGGGSGDGEDDAATRRARDVLAWADAHAPEAHAAWRPVTLADGTRAEVGGLDPFVALAPPRSLLEPALAVHTETVLELARSLPRVELLELEAEELGAGVVRVRAVAGNVGDLPTHTAMARRAASHLPVRLELATGDGVALITGQPAVAAERLEERVGVVEGEWLVRVDGRRPITVEVLSDNAGSDRRTVTPGREGGR